ncbi:MAG: hypothetical protein JJ902_09430 [Roseibium sp.]|nr:hypothetical protein [Roseibium sp.]
MEPLFVFLGYVLFIPLIWQIGNAIIKWIVFRAVDDKLVLEPEKHAEVVRGDDIETAAARVPKIEDSDEKELKAGRVIGLLERVLIVSGLVLDKWEVLLAVVALKTVTRYKELDTKLNAEYFLIGSLASIVWAIAMAVCLLLYDQLAGWSVFPSSLLGKPGRLAPQIWPANL